MPPRRRPVRLPVLLLIGGLALIAAGSAVLALAPATQLGWFAYAPLPESGIAPSLVVGGAHVWAAAAAVAVGLVASSGAAGYLAGRRIDEHP